MLGKGGLQTLIDLGVVHPMSGRNNTDKALFTATSYENAKDQKYRQASQTAGFNFMPVIIETTGAIGNAAEAFFKQFISNSTKITDLSFATHKSKLMQKVAVAVARSIGNKFTDAFKLYHKALPNYAYNSRRHTHNSRGGRFPTFNHRHHRPAYSAII